MLRWIVSTRNKLHKHMAICETCDFVMSWLQGCLRSCRDLSFGAQEYWVKLAAVSSGVAQSFISNVTYDQIASEALEME